jgi:hypothetical protein
MATRPPLLSDTKARRDAYLEGIRKANPKTESAEQMATRKASDAAAQNNPVYEIMSRSDSDSPEPISQVNLYTGVSGPLKGTAAGPKLNATQSNKFFIGAFLLAIGAIPSMLGVYVIAWVDESKSGCTYAKLKGAPIKSLSIMCMSATMLLFMTASRFYIASYKGYWVRGLLHKRDKTSLFDLRLRIICALLLLTWFVSCIKAEGSADVIKACNEDVYPLFVLLPRVMSNMLVLLELFDRFYPVWFSAGTDDEKEATHEILKWTGKAIVTSITFCMWIVVVLRQNDLFDSYEGNTCAASGVVGFTLFPVLVFSTAVYAFGLTSSFLVDNARPFKGRVIATCVSLYFIFALLFITITKSSNAKSCDTRGRVKALDWLILVFAGLVAALVGYSARYPDPGTDFDPRHYARAKTSAEADKSRRDIEIQQLRF